MSTLTILRFPNPKLRTVAKQVNHIDEKIKTLIDDMFETMYERKGVGLAATQVDVHQRIFVTDCAGEDEAPQPLAFINPEITSFSKETKVYQEGCLSIPENYADVERSDHVTVKALDRDGKAFSMDCSGLLAVCVQHETDHLNGKLFIDYLSPAKQLLVRDKMKKYEKRLVKAAKKAVPAH
ncbi:MAG: peptide deformylase [Gammaproteobacteria bacterium]|nr:MAG: peptide deformylase [Gammaproteobacteria bacterium]